MRPPALLALVLLSACAGTVPVPVALPVPQRSTQPAGLQRVMGKDAATVVAVLGSPTLDRSEGPARVLQFARGACVLDLFLYPANGGVPRVTDAEARTPAGAGYDAGVCVEALAGPGSSPPR